MKKLPKFTDNIEWLRKSLTELGRPDLAEKIEDDWCWSEIGALARSGKVPREIIDAITAALIASGDVSRDDGVALRALVELVRHHGRELYILLEDDETTECFVVEKMPLSSYEHSIPEGDSLRVAIARAAAMLARDIAIDRLQSGGG